MLGADQIPDIVAGATVDAIRRARSGEIRTLGELETVVASSVRAQLGQLGPNVLAQLQEWIEPLSTKAVEAAKPYIRELLYDYLPAFAGIVGLFAAGAVLLGAAASKRMAQRQMRPRYRRNRRRYRWN